MNIKKWNDIKDDKPPINTLLIVLIDGGGIGFRRLTKSGWYDENEILDDSGLEYYKWTEIP